MFQYILRRFLLMIPTLFVISLVSFIVIQLPPGDFLTTYIASVAEQDGMVDQALVDALRHRYGLDQPQYVRYLRWMGNIFQGDWGRSLEWDRPVKELIGTRRLYLHRYLLHRSWHPQLPAGAGGPLCHLQAVQL
jgi:peptide/nickel transport system permease protein